MVPVTHSVIGSWLGQGVPIVRGCSSQPPPVHHHHHVAHPSGRQVSRSEPPAVSFNASHPAPSPALFAASTAAEGQPAAPLTHHHPVHSLPGHPAPPLNPLSFSSSNSKSSITAIPAPPQQLVDSKTGVLPGKRHTSGPAATTAVTTAPVVGGPVTAPVLLLVTDSSTQTVATTGSQPLHHPSNPFLFPQFLPKRQLPPTSAATSMEKLPSTPAEVLTVGQYTALAHRLPVPSQTLRRRSADPSELYRSRQSLRLGLARSTSASPNRCQPTPTRTQPLSQTFYFIH